MNEDESPFVIWEPTPTDDTCTATVYGILALCKDCQCPMVMPKPWGPVTVSLGPDERPRITPHTVDCEHGKW